MTIYVHEMLFHPSLISKDGFSKNEALVYSYLLAKQWVYEWEMEQKDERERDERRHKGWPVPEPWRFDGWFVCTQQEIQESLDIAPSVQATIIKKLIERGVIKTKRKGMPSQRFFHMVKDSEVENFFDEPNPKKRRKSNGSEKKV